MVFYADYGQVTTVFYRNDIIYFIVNFIYIKEFLFSSVKSYLEDKNIRLWNIGTPKVNKLGIIEAINR